MTMPVLPGLQAPDGSDSDSMPQLSGMLQQLDDATINQLTDAANQENDAGTLDDLMAELNETPADEAAESPDEQAAEDAAGTEGQPDDTGDAEEAAPEMTEEEQAEKDAQEAATVAKTAQATFKTMSKMVPELKKLGIDAEHLDDEDASTAAVDAIDEAETELDDLIDEAETAMNDCQDAADDEDLEKAKKAAATLAELHSKAEELMSTAHETVDQGASAAPAEDGSDESGDEDDGSGDLALWAKSGS